MKESTANTHETENSPATGDTDRPNGDLGNPAALPLKPRAPGVRKKKAKPSAGDDYWPKYLLPAVALALGALAAGPPHLLSALPEHNTATRQTL